MILLLFKCGFFAGGFGFDFAKFKAQESENNIILALSVDNLKNRITLKMPNKPKCQEEHICNLRKTRMTP